MNITEQLSRIKSIMGINENDENYVSSWDKARKEKLAELNKHTILGKKVLDTIASEGGDRGFELEDDFYVVANGRRIIIYQGDDMLKSQWAGSEYDYISSYKKLTSEDPDDQPVFQTKADATTFMYLLKKEFGQYDSFKDIKINLKYIFTPDQKIKSIPDININKLNTLKSKVIKISPYNYTITEIEPKSEENERGVDITLKQQSKEDDIWGTTISLTLVTYYNEMGQKQRDYIALYEMPVLGKLKELKYTDYPDVINLIKELKKYL